MTTLICNDISHVTTHYIMVTSSHLCFCSYTYVALYSFIGSCPALSSAHWFLNAEVCECVFTKHTASIEIGSQEPTLPCQGLGMGTGE